jgi:probable HAF family extracellular repeat protein
MRKLASFKILILPVTLAAFLLFGSTTFAQRYNLLEISTLGGNISGAADINDQFAVVGSSTNDNSALHAYIWYLGFAIDLGVPGGNSVSAATAINYGGSMTGYAEGDDQSRYAYLIQLSGDRWTYLGTLPNLDYSEAVDINNYDQIAGYSFMLGPDGGSMAWVWENGDMSPLGTLGGSRSKASAINQGGAVIGYSEVFTPDNSINHACLWINDAIIDLGVLPGETNSAANDLNDYNHAVGASSHQQETYPFLTVSRPCLWIDDQIIELELPDGFVTGIANGINDHGQIVGSMNSSLSGGRPRAFIWQNGVLTDLNDLVNDQPDWELQTASSINELGYIVGSGLNPNGDQRGFLLAPVQTDINELTAYLPSAFLIANNYPNPFNNRTVIEYSLPEAAAVKIEIFNLLGQIAETLVDSYQAGGKHQAVWNADSYSSGVYFYRIQANNDSQSGMMTLIK